jgi:hypothetical protein
MTPVAFAQTTTLECYYNDTIVAPDCIICNKPQDIEVYTGLIAQKGSVRTKLYFPYQIKIRDSIVVIYDSKDHAVNFSLNNTPQFANKIQLIDWLKQCHFNTDSLSGPIDTIFIIPGGGTDNDKQVVLSFYIDGLDSLHIHIQNDSTGDHAVYLGDLMGGGGTGMDKQRFDTSTITNDTLVQSLQRDSVGAIKLSLKRYLDSIKIFARSGDTLKIQIGQDSIHFLLLPQAQDTQSLYNVGQDSIGITLGNKIKIIENQYLDTFRIVGNILQASVKDDNMPLSFVDLTTYVNVGTNLTYTQATNTVNSSTGTGTIITGFGSNINIFSSLSDKDGDIGSNNQMLVSTGGQVDWRSLSAGNSGITISGLTISATDTSNINELQSYIHTGTTSYTNTLSQTSGTSSFTLQGSGLTTISHNGFGIVTISSSYNWLLNATQDAYVATTINNGNTVNFTGTGGIQTILASSGSSTMQVNGANIQWIASAQSGSSQLIGDAVGINNHEQLYFKGTGSASTSIMTTGLDVDTLYINAYDSQRVLTFKRFLDTISIRITNDTTRFLILPKTDTQRVNLLKRILDTVFIRITNDTTNYFLLPKDSVGQDTQSIYISGIDTLGITRGNKIRLPRQYFDTATIINDTLLLSIFNDGQPAYRLNLKPYVNVIPNLSYTQLTNTVNISGGGTPATIPGFGANINILAGLGDKDSQLGSNNQLLVSTGTLVDWRSIVAGNSGITINGLTISATDTSNTNELQSLNTVTLVTSLTGGSFGSVQYIPSTGVQIIQGGTALNATLKFITADSSITNELQNYNASGLVIGLTQSSSSITLINGNNMSIVSGGTASNPTYTFNSTSQDSQSLSLVVDSLGISRGNKISLSKYIDAPQTYSHSGTNSYTNTLSITNPSFTLLGSTGVILSHNGTGTTTFRAADSSATNELQNFSASGLTIGLTQSSSTVQLIQTGSISIVQGGTTSNPTYTFSSLVTDNQYLDTFRIFNNQLQASLFGDNRPFSFVNLAPYIDSMQVLSTVLNTMSLSQSGGSVQYIGNTGLTIVTGGTTLNASLTFTVADSSKSNEGLLGVGAGGSTSSTLLSNTFGQVPITINASGILSITESPSSNGGSITLTALEVQALNTVGLTTTLTGGTSIQFINSPSVTITQGGTASNATFTFNAAVGDADWFETTGLTIPGTVPPDAITDTMYHMGYTAIGMIHPFYMLDVSEDARINGHQIGTGPNVAANSNIRFGKDALMNSSGTFNMAFGMNALKSMTSSLKNIAIGYNSQTAYISGTGLNLSIGMNTLQVGTNITDNTIIGQESVRSATLANYNTAIGHENMAFALDAQENTTVGDWALYSDTKPFQNTSIGRFTMRDGRIFSGNVALGSFAMQSIGDTAQFNIAIGFESLYGDFATNIGNKYNLAIGFRSLKQITNSSDSNIVIGVLAGYGINGNSNIVTGNNSQISTIGSNNVTYGNNIQVGTSSNNSLFGSNQTVSTSGNVRISNGSGVTALSMLSSGFVGIGGELVPTQTLHVTGTMRLTGAFYDGLNLPGTNGQILSSTATGTKWIAASGGTATTIQPYTVGTVKGFTTSANDTFEIRVTRAYGGSGGSGSASLTFTNSVSPVTLSAGVGSTVNFAASPTSGIVLSQGSATLNFSASDTSKSNEGSLNVLAGAINTSLIHSNTSGSTDITLQGNNTNVFLTESGNTIIVAAKDTQKLYYDSITNIIRLGGDTIVQLKRNYGSASATNLTYGTATTTSDSILSSTGTDIAIKVGGTLQIDSTSSSSMRIKDNKIWYSIPNFSGSPNFTPFTTLPSSNSPTLELNSTYLVKFTSNATIASGGGGIAIMLNSSTAGWTATGKTSAEALSGTSENTVRQLSINTNFAPTGSNPAGTNFIPEGTYILKTNGTAGTIFFSVAGNLAPMTLTDIRVTLEKM